MNPSELTQRGVGFQAIGFGLVGCASVAILTPLSGSDYWVYEAFEIAATKLHWSFVVPLAVIFDRGRMMFEKAQAIREAKKAQIREQGRKQGRIQENARIRALLDRHDVSLPPEVVEEMFGGQRRD